MSTKEEISNLEDLVNKEYYKFRKKDFIPIVGFFNYYERTNRELDRQVILEKSDEKQPFLIIKQYTEKFVDVLSSSTTVLPRQIALYFYNFALISSIVAAYILLS